MGRAEGGEESSCKFSAAKTDTHIARIRRQAELAMALVGKLTGSGEMVAGDPFQLRKASDAYGGAPHGCHGVWRQGRALDTRQT